MASRIPILVVAVVSAVLGVVLLVSSRQEARLARANAALSGGHPEQALAELGEVSGVFALRASALRGYAYLRSGQIEQADAAFRTAVRRDPNNWVLQRDYAIVLLGVGRRLSAGAHMRVARSLNPRMPLPAGFVSRLGSRARIRSLRQ